MPMIRRLLSDLASLPSKIADPILASNLAMSSLDTMFSAMPISSGVTIEQDEIQEMHLDIIEPAQKASNRLVLHLGASFFHEMPFIHLHFASRLAKQAELTVIYIRMPPIPEISLAQQSLLISKAISWGRRRNPPSELVVGVDGPGSLALMHSLHDIPQALIPHRCYFMSPLFDVNLAHNERLRKIINDDRILSNEDLLKNMSRRLFIQIGTKDDSAEEARLLVSKCSDIGVLSSLQEYHGSISSIAMLPFAPGSSTALTDLAKFCREGDADTPKTSEIFTFPAFC